MKTRIKDTTMLKIALLPAFVLTTLVVALSLLAMSISSAVAGDMYNKQAANGDIVDTAVAAGSFDTLVSAVETAGLVDTLKGEGPFTVFAPTDEAFAKIPKETLDNLLQDKEALTQVLTYHVVSGKVMAADIVNIDSAKTVQGQSISISTGDDGVMVDNAKVVKADIVTSNGVIHVIDSVMIPKS